MKKVLIIGAGGRGLTYSRHMAALKEDFQIVGVAEPDERRRTYMQEKYEIPAQMCHPSWEDFLSRPKFADLVVIATMDRDHFAPTMEAALNASAPNMICAYIYELAGAVNKFYHETRILTEEDKNLQAGYISLIGLAKQVLETCIDILGFSAPEKM